MDYFQLTMNSINIEIERGKKRFFIRRLENELSTLDESNARYTYLHKIHAELMKAPVGLDKMLEQASAQVYTKKWNRMPNYHKIQKIKEYLDEKYGNSPNRIGIERLLIDKLTNGLLNSCKNVEYDTNISKISKIKLSKTEIY